MTSAYDDLLQRLRRIHALSEAAGVLQWDQQTMMPPGGTEPRAQQLATLSTLAHELFTSPEVGKLLEAAERDARSGEQEALLRETRFAYERATRVPGSLVEALSQATSRSLPVWVAAKAKADFARFRPVLEEIVDLRRRYAEAVDPDRPAYEALFQDYEPWLRLAEVREDLTGLRRGLVPLLERAREHVDNDASAFVGTWPAPAQMALCEQVLDLVGYDRTHGRLDASAHPFSTGNAYDARITTRYDESDPLSAITCTLHEFGHALYTLGLPKEHHGTPLGEARDLVVHESQSRLWENHVGRSLPFWERLLPMVQKAFPDQTGGLAAEAAWRAANQVRPSLVRVEADELTYHIHIGLRFELEEALFSERLEVAEVPQAWNEIVERDLGLDVPDDAVGCLQDVHWAHGAFGYFPTYSLGSMLAAQLFEAYERSEGSADDDLRAGRFEGLRTWLLENVHRHGRRYKTSELVERASGSPLSPAPFLRYAATKFDRLWSL